MSVNEKKRGRPSGKGSQLSQATIIEQAKVMMAEEGKIPSIRKLALALNVDAMAIYHYFKNKEALLEAITVSLVTDIYEPQFGTPWRQALESLCHSYLSLLASYSGLLETLLTMKSTGPAQVFTERFNCILEPLALDESIRNDALGLLVDYLHGFALAMKCSAGALTIEMCEGAVAMYCRALENESASAQ
ncbi:transcriptional regulator [Photobacterium jeanii]|uniref:Transcriptional regulator n=1 Tax=Photobacterium jeanii TaxID=858640 RepID=A0A178K7K3_9GAMM|nr:TetR/AcrR family transcriptional regulator [Photobacterium jeanii]OAN13107.1 transcriptional regulator [Photobacterium jeanii]PST89257.1 TetR/AcrR family transcriptional regulator [Photobacterium jeanii]